MNMYAWITLLKKAGVYSKEQDKKNKKTNLISITNKEENY